MPTANAAVLSASHEPFVLEAIEVESPRRGEVLVTVRRQPRGRYADADRSGHDLHGHCFGQSSLATRALAPVSSVITVPREAPLEILGPLACGIQTGAASPPC